MWSATKSKFGFRYVIFVIKLRKYSKLSYIHNPTGDPLRSLTVGRVLEQAAKNYGDRPAVISKSQSQTVTFQEALAQADRLAAGLKAVGMNVGDRVGIWAPNVIEWYITHMACARGGYVLVNLNPAYQPHEIESCINAVGLKGLICTHKFKTQNYYEHLVEIAPEIPYSSPGKLKSKNTPSLKSIIISGQESLKGVFNYEEVVDLPSEGDVERIRKLQEFIDPDEVCHLQFTSGTTGKPKVPMQTHFQLVNNSYFLGKRNELDKKHQIVCVQVPFFHVFGTVVAIGSALNHGATLVLPAPSFNADKSLDAIRDEKCTVIYGTPTMYVDLISRQKTRKEDIAPEIAVSGGAPCSPHLFKEMKEVLKLKKIKSIFGLTETTAVIFQSMYDDDEKLSTSTVGYVMNHLEAKVIDSEGKIVPRGSPGELLVRGYSNCLGYWQNEEKTKELMGLDRWLHTGDQFVIEENGYGRVVGRLKDIIIRGGENIFPKEIEDLLNTHPHILETQVVGAPHERLGEEVCACVRLEQKAAVTLDDIQSYCKGKIAHFKIPSRLEIVDSFPKTASGKIQKFKIVQAISSGK